MAARATRAKSRGRARRSRHRRPVRLSRAVKALIAAGALAGAIGSIIALGDDARSLFRPAPEGLVSGLKVNSVEPLTWGDWVKQQTGSNAGVREDLRDLKGRLILFQLQTEGVKHNAELPVRIVLHDATQGVTVGNPREFFIKVANGSNCGCSDWIAVPADDHRYYVEVAVYRPGPIRGEALQRVTSRRFPGRDS